MNPESTSKIMIVALGVCFVCAVLVSTAVVTLKPRQEQNQEMDRLKNILAAGGLDTESGRLQDIYREFIRAEIIDLESGTVLKLEELPEPLTPDKFDIKEIAKNPEYSRVLNSDEDPAQIKRMLKVMIVYNVMDSGSVKKHILPVYGKGLWSTMYGMVTLGSDLETIESFLFYEHGETPGLGGEVDNPRWKALWIGKQAFENGELKIECIKGKVDRTSPDLKYQVDGLSGSTLTTRGVNAMIRFWLGEGYGPYIRNLRSNLHRE